MKNKVVFFGEADYGKTTLIGYTLSIAENLDMDKTERRLKEKLGINYDEGILYSSLINENYLQSNTTTESSFSNLSDNPGVLEGEKIIKNNEDESVTKTTRIIGQKVEVTTTVHKKGNLSRFNTQVRGIRNISIDGIDIVAVDTPGHVSYLSEREAGMSLGDVGVFCLAIDKVLSEDFSEASFRFANLWRTYHKNSKFICLLTMCDLKEYSEEAYNTACNKIHQYSKSVDIEEIDLPFGESMAVTKREDEITAIIPVAVEYRKRQGVNILEPSDKTPWYHGPVLIDAIRSMINEIRKEKSVLIPQNTLVYVDKEIGITRTRAGKVWRVVVQNGSIGVDDKIKFCNVSIAGMQGVYDVVAEVKSIHAEHHISEGIKEVQRANKGEIVSINIRNCYVNNRRIDKGDIKVNRETIIYSADEATEKLNEFYIRLPNIDLELKLLDIGQDVLIRWFGDRITAKIVGFPDDLDGIYVRVSGNPLSIPTDFGFRNLSELKETQLSLQKGVDNFYKKEGNFHYITGEFVFSRSKLIHSQSGGL